MSDVAGERHRSWQLVLAVVLTAAAGGMGWGIRGQYGHETGAMIAGVLVGFTLVLLFLPRGGSLRAARVVALVALGISFGGSMTYGQTIGLTQNPALIGNWAALRWGLLGLCIKGGIWIGFAGALLGMGVSGKRYRPGEMVLVLLAMLALQCVGMWLLNSPFDPARRMLPRIYFSASWYWEPTADLKPRPECWGGLLLALGGLIGYLYGVRKDRLAGNMALVGCLAGGIGFPAGQCVQAFHAWNPQLFVSGWWSQLAPHVNWWNMMEVSFGAIGGGLLGAGLWMHRRLIPEEVWGDLRATGSASVSGVARPARAELVAPTRTDVVVTPVWEFALAIVYVVLVVGAEFSNNLPLELFLEFGLVVAVIPLIGILGGRYWPYLFSLPIVALPIAGKTLRELSYKNAEVPLLPGWILMVVVPLGVTCGLALWLAQRGKTGQSARSFARFGLLTTIWLYFGLNLCFFRFPWPWQTWTSRTPSGIIFTLCAVVLTLAAIFVSSPLGERDEPDYRTAEPQNK